MGQCTIGEGQVYSRHRALFSSLERWEHDIPRRFELRRTNSSAGQGSSPTLNTWLDQLDSTITGSCLSGLLVMVVDGYIKAWDAEISST